MNLNINIPKPNNEITKLILVIKLLSPIGNFNKLSDTEISVLAISIIFFINNQIIPPNKLIGEKLNINNSIIANIKTKLKKLGFIENNKIELKLLELVKMNQIIFNINEN